VLLTNFYSSDHIEMNEKGGANVALWEAGEVHKRSWWGNLKVGGHLEDLCLDGWITFKLILQEVVWGGMGWNELAQYRDRRQALVYAVMNLQVPQNAGNFLTS
jgi:hypothetical protein